MNKEVLIEAIYAIWNSYDAFYFNNKYGENTHKKEFKLLEERFKYDEKALQAIEWIKHSYDCYYKEEFIEELNGCKNVFVYLKDKIRSIENEDRINK